jgi:hypothetical protein
MVEKDTLDQVGVYAGNLSLVEVGLGSLLHGFKIPFSGHILSLNQGAVLTHAYKRLTGVSVWTLFLISAICAVLKSLSPAGRKLGPMLSIGMQGFLYSFGLLIGGRGVVGVFLGMGWLSLWAFVQPFLTYFIFYGSDFLAAILFYSEKLASKFGLSVEDQGGLVLGLIALKFLVAGLLGIFVYQRSSQNMSLLQNPKWLKASIPLEREADISTWQVIWLSLKDLMRPLFIVSLILMVIFFSFSKHSWGQVIALSLRPIGVAFIFFFVSRHPFIYNKMGALRKYAVFSSFLIALDSTRKYLAEDKTSDS